MQAFNLRITLERSDDKDLVNSDKQVKITFNLSECFYLLNSYMNLKIHVANKHKKNVKFYKLNQSIIAKFQKNYFLNLKS